LVITDSAGIVALQGNASALGWWPFIPLLPSMTLRFSCPLLVSSCVLVASAFAGEWHSLFNGKDFSGWQRLGGQAHYAIVDGAIVGTAMAETANTFLRTEQDYGDFIFECEMMQVTTPTNSGIQFRSLSTPDYMEGRVHGYQFELDPSARAWTGGIYDEARRGWLYPGTLNPSATSAYQFGRWNHLRIEAIGNTIRTWVNGVPVSHLVDAMTLKGFIALQVHSISRPEEAGSQLHWRNLRIQTDDLKPSPDDGLFVRSTLVNELAEIEKARGWKLLWDGQTSQGWRSVKGEAFPASGWEMKDGVLSVLASEKGSTTRGGDIVTTEEFGPFELQLEFKVTEGANSGIKYFTVPGTSSALEYQILDDEKHPDAKLGAAGNRQVAALYDLIPREKMPAGLAIGPRANEWQHARIISRANGEVEHWLNGVRVLKFDRTSPLFAALVARSKFAGIEKFGEGEKTAIVLQDHGDLVHYRSIKIRSL
jgi:hypothetical protein